MSKTRQFTSEEYLAEIASEIQNLLDEGGIMSSLLWARLNIVKRMALLALKEGTNGQED